MPYQLIRGRPLAQEVRRLLDQETLAMTSGLTQASRGRSKGVHDARKHIKKARALLMLVRGASRGGGIEADEQLRTAKRALGPLADAQGSLQTLAALHREGVVQLPAATFASVRLRLASRASAIEHDATLEELRGRIVRLIEGARQQIGSADLHGLDRAAVVGAIRDAHGAARSARRRATRRPSADTFHAWRRRVKREWHLLRLVAELTGERLKDQRRQLAALDACLGELHDVEVLMRAVAADAPLSRMEMSALLRMLRLHARDLRHLARRLSSVLDERPQQLARRVRVVWGSIPSRRDAVMARAWPRSA